MRSLIAAIDLGTSNVRCVVGEKISNQIKIIGCSSAPSEGIMRGNVVNIQNLLDCILPVKQNIEGAIGYKINEVFISTSGQNIKTSSTSSAVTRPNADQIINEEEIDAITKEMLTQKEGEVVLHAIPQSYNIGDFMGIKNPIGMTGATINANFMMITTKESTINLSKNVIVRAGLVTRGIAFGALATAKAVVTSEEEELGVALVNIGGGTTEILIIQDNIVRYASVIPFGGNSITEDIKIGCSVTSNTAEQIKKEYGSCMSNYAPNKTIIIPGTNGATESTITFKTLANIIGARCEELLEAVKYEIVKSGYNDKIRAGVVLTGGTANISNILQLAKIVLEHNTRNGNILNSINCSEVNTTVTPEYATAVGLTILGFEQMAKERTIYNTATEIDYSLFNEEEKKGQEGDETAKAESTQEKDENQESEQEGKKEKKEKKKSRFSFKNVFKQFTNNEMFNENDA